MEEVDRVELSELNHGPLTFLVYEKYKFNSHLKNRNEKWDRDGR